MSARRLGASRQLGGVEARRIPAAAHLQGHGHADGPDDRLDQAHGVAEVAHQRRAGQLARDLAGRAAHVDVDDVGAQLFRHARPFRHPARLAARQLYDEGSKIPANCPFTHAVAVLDQVFARHHLRRDERGPQKMRWRRNGRSVTPDIGANSRFGRRATEQMGGTTGAAMV